MKDFNYQCDMLIFKMEMEQDGLAFYVDEEIKIAASAHGIQVFFIDFYNRSPTNWRYLILQCPMRYIHIMWLQVGLALQLAGVTRFATLMTMVVVHNRENLGNIDKKKIRGNTIAPARSVPLNHAVKIYG